MLQDELNEEAVERAYVNYLYKLNDVARLEICGVHYESEKKTLHVFGRTAGNPPAYFYRRWEKRREWTPWEKVELDIFNAEGVEEPQTGVLLLPVVHNRRLFLFWPVFTLKRDKPDDDAKKEIESYEFTKSLVEENIRDLENQGGMPAEIANAKAGLRALENDLNEMKAGKPFFSVKMACTQYRQGHWTAKKLTNEALRTPYFEDEFANAKDIYRYFFIPKTTDQEGELEIKWYFNSNGTTYYNLYSYFKFDSCQNELIPVKSKKAPTESKKELPDEMRYMKARDVANASKVPLSVVNAADETDLLLNGAEKRHLLSLSLAQGVFKQTTPFFYEDSRRTFLVIPPPTLRIPSAAISVSLQSNVLAGKVERMRMSAYQWALEPSPEPQPVENMVQLIGKETISSHFFQASEAERVIIRPGESSAVIPAGQNELSAGPSATLPVDTSEISFAPGIILGPEGEYVFRTFYQPYVCLFLKQLNRYGIEGLLNPNTSTSDGKTLYRQETPDHYESFDFNAAYDPNQNEVKWKIDHPKEIITFDYEDAYAIYNWELFFHIPLLIATRLFQDQRFEEAQHWFHYIFNPTETEGDAPYRFWKIKPFHTYTPQQMKADMELLLQGKLESQIQAWEEDPFNPHLLAASGA